LIDFDQAGDGTHAAAPQKQQSITVGPASQSITVTSTAPAGATVAGPSYTPTATSSAGLTVAITLDAASAGCSLSGGVVSFTTVGTCVIDFNQAGNGTYAPATQQQRSVPVALQSQTITPSTAPTSATVGGANYSPTATASSGLTVAITLDSSSAGCSLSGGGVVSFTSAGTCLIDFSQAGNGTYAAAPPVVQAIPVDLYSQTITVNSAAPTGATAGGPTYTPTATSSSGLAVAITLDLASTGCSLSGGVVSFTSAGTCLIDFSQAGNGAYAAAPERQQAVAVGQGSQSISFTSTAPADATVGGTSYSPTATASSGLTVGIMLDSSSTGCSLGFGVVSFTAIGTCVIDANQPGDADYRAAPQAQQSIAVAAAPTTVSPAPAAPAQPSQTSNPAPPALSLLPPVLSSSADLTPVSGAVLIRLPDAATFTPLSTAINIPLGSTIDATNGTVSLTVALPNGASQTGQFYGGEFVLTQSKNGMTIATLAGGSYAGCPAPTKKGSAMIAASKKKPASVIRQLWGNAHGNYTTKGRYGSAAVSGTVWLTQDRCDGTYVRVTKDNVIVVAYAHAKKKHNVRQGHHILVPAPGF
jgi:hypothetical protein